MGAPRHGPAGGQEGGMSTGALLFLIGAWVFVLGLTLWSFVRLMQTDPSREAAPPPGTSL
jgi:hypothetical protein